LLDMTVIDVSKLEYTMIISKWSNYVLVIRWCQLDC